MTFNREAAAKAYDMIMKMDEDEARIFTTMVVTDVCVQDMDNNHRVLQRHLDRVVNKRLEVAKRTIAKSYRDGGPTEELLAAAGAIGIISKASRAPLFDPDEHPRDRTGRFRSKIKHNPKAPLLQGKALGLSGVPEKKGLSRNNLKEFQQSYQQIATFLQSANSAGLDKYRLEVQDKKSGNRYFVPNNTGTKPDQNAWDPKHERVVSVEARTDDLHAAGATFNLMSALGAGPRAAAQTGYGVEAAGEGLGDFANGWYKEDPHSSNSPVYNRLLAGSQYVNQIAPKGGKVEMATKFGEFVGTHGPEAERVFGPPTRRTMYRYRGTERTPDKDVLRNYEIMRSRAVKEGASPEQTGQGVLATYLGDRVPSQELFDLQLASGHTPPSEGFIVDRNGKVVVQAVGYGDDHYLPFNLKNLKGLKGGEYIRTRSVGGPTSEDIYTGLMSGARGLTVVSRSGTFRIEFENDFRGGRRYNQKATRMTGRYRHLLDAVKSNQVKRKSFPPEQMLRIQEELEAQYGATHSPAEIQGLVRDRVREESSASYLTPKERELIDSQLQIDAAHHRTPLDTPAGRAMRADAYNAALERKAINHKLNGPGYKSAMDALREQFPYYIKDTLYSPKRAEGRYEPETDKGYVKPRHNRPEAAQEGWYDKGITRGSEPGKFSAEQADYQNGRRTKVPDSPSEETKEGEAGKPSEAKLAAMKRVEENAESGARDEFGKQFVSFKKKVPLPTDLQGRADVFSQYPFMSMDDDKLEEWAKKPGSAKVVLDFLDAQESTLLDNGEEWRDRIHSLRKLAGGFGGKPFAESNPDIVPESPYTFPGEVSYMRGQKQDAYRQEWTRLDKNENFSGQPFSQMSDKQLKDEAELTSKAKRQVAKALEAKKRGDEESLAEIPKLLQLSPDQNLAEFKVVQTAMQANLIDAIERHQENVHRARRLRQVGGDADAVTIPAARPPSVQAESKVEAGSNREQVRQLSAYLVGLPDKEWAHGFDEKRKKDLSDAIADLNSRLADPDPISTDEYLAIRESVNPFLNAPKRDS